LYIPNDQGEKEIRKIPIIIASKENSVINQTMKVKDFCNEKL
jgi:hypothetical protein